MGDIGFFGSLLCSASAACTGEALSIPLDTAKVRLMLQQGKAEAGALKYNGLIGTIGTVAKEEGPLALFKGLTPGLHRQCVFGGLRLGLYEPVKGFYSSLGGAPIVQKIAAGLTTGAIGITVANPTDLVKVRMQAQKSGPPKYPSAMKAYGMILKEEGVAGLWTGYGANLARNSVMSCVEVVGYDVSKEALLGWGMKDGIGCHILGGLSAGFMATIVANPIDVMKNRLMADSAGQYKGLVDCSLVTLRTEGPMAFYKGFIPFFARVGWFNVAVFVTLEQYRSTYISFRG